jgi:hypothetical protein
MNNDWIVKTISEKIYQKYPEFSGIQPSIKWNSPPQAAKETCVLTFQTTVTTGTGKKIARRVKVISDLNGNIQKISSSK